MEIIVGRRALNFWLGKEVEGDIDIWGLADTYLHKGNGVDYCCMPEEVMSLFRHTGTGYACLEDLLAIKMSHFGYDIFWEKHKKDILFLTKHLNGNYNVALYKALKEHWKDEFRGDKPFLSLYKTKDAFFDDFVPKKYEHDMLHELVSYPNSPIYSTCLKDGHEVFIDKEKWKALAHEKKVLMLKEEMAVIALERWIIPMLQNHNKSITLHEAWAKSLHKTTTALTKGVFTDFIVENIFEFLHPLREEMLYVLENLNLKEKYMAEKISLEDFVEMVNTALSESGQSCSWNDGGVFEECEIAFGDFEITNHVEHIEQEGGGEGGAEECHTVIRLKDKYYKMTYRYYSHHGYDFDYSEVFEVKPVQRNVTFYE